MMAPPITCNKVLLPLPLGPSSAVRLPLARVRPTPSNTTSRPKCLATWWRVTFIYSASPRMMPFGLLLMKSRITPRSGLRGNVCITFCTARSTLLLRTKISR